MAALCIIWKNPYRNHSIIHIDMPTVSLFGMKQLCIFWGSIRFPLLQATGSPPEDPNPFFFFFLTSKGSWPKVSRVLKPTSNFSGLWHLVPGQSAARSAWHFGEKKGSRWENGGLSSGAKKASGNGREEKEMCMKLCLSEKGGRVQAVSEVCLCFCVQEVARVGRRGQDSGLRILTRKKAFEMSDSHSLERIYMSLIQPCLPLCSLRIMKHYSSVMSWDFWDKLRWNQTSDSDAGSY